MGWVASILLNALNETDSEAMRLLAVGVVGA